MSLQKSSLGRALWVLSNLNSCHILSVIHLFTICEGFLNHATRKPEYFAYVQNDQERQCIKDEFCTNGWMANLEASLRNLLSFVHHFVVVFPHTSMHWFDQSFQLLTHNCYTTCIRFLIWAYHIYDFQLRIKFPNQILLGFTISFFLFKIIWCTSSLIKEPPDIIDILSLTGEDKNRLLLKKQCDESLNWSPFWLYLSGGIYLYSKANCSGFQVITALMSGFTK